MSEKEKGITFELPEEQARAIRALAGDRKVRIGATVIGSGVRVDFVACNSPFVACNSPFVACNAPFVVTRYGPYEKLQA